MNASILLVGEDEFLALLLEQTRRFVACSVEVAASAKEAMPLIQAQQPDIVVVQKRLQDSLDLCHQIKDQTKLAWIYCIVLDDAKFDVNQPPEWEWMVRMETLSEGADAYLWLPSAGMGGKGESSYRERLFKAQVITGLRMVKTYRELMRTNDILSAIALSDPLTELNNRRALDWELPRQVQNARARQEPLSVMMLDVDFFKRINDTYGHAAGDRALQLISSRLRHNLRFRDTLFRYGGEEFVILLSSTDQQEARLVGQRLCRLVSEQPFLLADDLNLPITISAGTASLVGNDDSKGHSLLQRADYHLLRAKSNGRNQVVSEPEPGVSAPL